jgi:hypothetical protein
MLPKFQPEIWTNSSLTSLKFRLKTTRYMGSSTNDVTVKIDFKKLIQKIKLEMHFIFFIQKL